MSIPINTDNSVQLSYSSFPFTITNVDNYASSNFILSLSSNNSNYTLNASNALKANIDLKQNTLTASTNLLGIGTAITAIDYNKISVNKPTNFQADWLTTIINKPTYFQTDWNSTISNKPTNFQADWLSTIINKPSTFPADMSIIYTKNEVNNISNVLQTNINTKENILTFSSPLTRTTNTIGINLASYSTTGNDANYLLKTGGDISGTLNFGSRVQNFLINLYGTNEYGFGITGGALMYHCMGSHNFYTNQILKASISSSGTITATTFSGSGSSLTDIPYASITGKPTNFQADWLSTIINKPSTFPATMTDIYTKIETNNLLNAKEAVLTFSSPLTRTTNTIGINLGSYSTTGNDANYLLKTGGTMSGQISGITTLTATTINSTILTTTNNASVLGPTKGINGGNGDRLVLWAGNAIVYPYSLGINDSTLWYSVPDGATHKFYINGSSITTISSTGLSTTGTINASTNLQENGTNLTSKYLQLGGGTMTGQLQLTTATGNNSLLIYSSVTNAINNIELKNNLNKSCYIGIGGSGYNGNYIDNLFIQSPTALILNTNGNGTASTPNFIIKNNGNIGIGNLSADAGKLCIGSSVYSDGANDGTLVISKTNAINAHRSFKFGYDTNYNFCMGDNLGNGVYTWRSTDFNMRYFDGNIGMGVAANATHKLDVNGSLNASTIYRAGVEIDSRYLKLSGGIITASLRVDGELQVGDASYQLLLSKPTATTAATIQTIQQGVGYNQNLTLQPNGGNVGISTNNPSCKLSLGTATGYKVLSLWDNATPNNFQFVGFGNNGGLCLNTNTTTDAFQFRVGATTTTANELMRLSGTGNLSLGTTNTSSYKMRIRGANPTFLRIETDFSDAGQVSGIEFGIPNFTNAGTAKITSTTYGNDVNDLRFSTSSGPNSTSIKMTINGNGNISCTNDFTAAGPITSTSTTPSAFSFINIYHAPLLRTTHIPFMDNNIYLRAPVKIDFDNLSFGSRINDYLIYLYGGGYGFGINANTLRYNSDNNHSFYSAGIMKANIDNTGTITATTFSGTTLLASGTSKASKFMIRLGEQTG